MMDYNSFFTQSLNELKNNGNYRYFKSLKRSFSSPTKAYFIDDKKCSKEITVWCSNDYLGMSKNHRVIDKMQEVLAESGAGAGGTRNIAGTSVYHLDLEKEVASLHAKESALLFSSGYMSNWGTLSMLGAKLPNCLILSDEDNHASMIEGIRHSQAQKVIFNHNDIHDLENKLKQIDINQPKIIAFESVYSMDGSIAPIEQICDLANKYNSLTYIDEVHAVGLYGSQGGGLSQELGLAHRLDIIEGTFAKAYGVIGGYIAANRQLCDFIRSFSSGFIFSTALPPAISAGIRESVKYLKNSNKERIKQQQNVNYLKKRLSEEDIYFIPNKTHIIAVIVGNAQKCRAISDDLLDRYNIYIQPINYPTVAVGTERFRITPSPFHTRVDLDNLIKALVEMWYKFDLYE